MIEQNKAKFNKEQAESYQRASNTLDAIQNAKQRKITYVRDRDIKIVDHDSGKEKNQVTYQQHS